MTFTVFRRFLFQVHMWIGLTLGLLFAALGLSGSAIVYDQEIANFFDPPPSAVAQGAPLSLDAIAAAARKGAAGRGQLQISLPLVPGSAVPVRVSQPPRAEGSGAGRAGRRRGTREGGARPGQVPAGPGAATQMFIDPVSGALLGTRTSPLPPFLVFAHQLHGNFLMGRDGRSYVVGWLGVGMCILGVTGLVLWWPRRGQWKYAFFVRRNAKGLRFHRELHAAVGIWIFVVFMAVSFSGVVLAWPQVMGAPGFDPRALPRLAPGDNRITADAALDLAQKALPDATPRSITLPARDDQPVNVAFFSHGSVAATVLVDPYLGKVIATRDPSESFLAWQRPVHQGLLGPVWRFLVFLSGFVPALFVVTGVVMWWKKYRRRIPMNAPLAEAAAE